MAGSVDGAKDGKTEEAAEADAVASAPVVPATPKEAEGLGKTSLGKTGLGKSSPGKSEPDEKPSAGTAVPRRMPALRIDARMAAVATVALVVGTAFGMLSAPRGRSGESLARVESGVEAGRAESARLTVEMGQLAQALVAIRDANEATRSEAKVFGASVTERLARMEQGLDRKIAALTEKVGRVEREAATPLATTPAPVEKRAATPAIVAATTPVAAQSAPTKTEPMQTASVAEPKQKPETIESWALRDVYDGMAMLENRKRRLVEVAPGDSVPGIGRVESIERRGRNWVVVTRQGLITPQMW